MIFEHEIWAKGSHGKIEVSRVTATRSRKVDLETLRRHMAEWDRRLALARPKHRQILHLIDRFGGILNFSIAVNKHPDYILYRWLGVPKKGAIRTYKYGLVPSVGYLVRLLYAARSFGILLTPEDLFPDLIEDGVLKNPHSHPELKAWWTAMEPDVKLQQLETQIAELLEA